MARNDFLYQNRMKKSPQYVPIFCQKLVAVDGSVSVINISLYMYPMLNMKFVSTSFTKIIDYASASSGVSTPSLNGSFTAIHVL